MKKMLAFILTFALLITAFAVLGTIGVSAEVNPGQATLKLRETFKNDLVDTFEMENDGHLGIPVVLTTFVRNSVTANGASILYVVGHKEERMGTDTDEEIIEDMLAEGYSVTVLDYLDNPKAVGNEFAWSAHKIFCGDFKAGSYTKGYERKKYNNIYFVPAGCRVAREIYYYSLDTMARNGTNEFILWMWNEYYAGPDGMKKKSNGEDLPYAETIDDLIKPDGSKMDFDLRMDIVYPANPKDTVPVFTLASSSETRNSSFANANRPYFSIALLQGYAAVIYDHEYIPMSRDDHYGYYGNYTIKPSSFNLSYTSANAVHSAAIRRVRYLSEQFGYDADYICAFGFSKSNEGVVTLANKNHEQMGEVGDFAEQFTEGKDPDGYQGEQPWLTYEGTNEPISSNITVAYSGAGAGIGDYHEKLINENSVPIIGSAGTEDTMGSVKANIPKVIKFFESHPEIESDFLVAQGLGHNPAFGYDSEKQIEMFNEIWTYIDNHTKAAYSEVAPEVLWATPQSNIVHDSFNGPVTIKFSRAMDVDSVKENVKVIRVTDGKVMSGEWEVLHGGTTFKFNSSMIINGASYRIDVSAETKAKDGVAFGVPYQKTFTISGDSLLAASKDTYVSSANPDKNFGAEELVKVKNNDTEKANALVSFKNENGFSNVTKALLLLDRNGYKASRVQIYGTDNFDENTVTYNTAPENGQLITEADVLSQLTYVDVTDYIKNVQGDTVNLAFETEKEEVYSYYDFKGSNSNNFAYDTDYRFGGPGGKLVYSTEGMNDNGSLLITNRAEPDVRIKMLKSFGTTTLTQEHLGKTLKASFWIKPTGDASLAVVGMYAKSLVSGVKQENFEVVPGEWNYLEYFVTVDQNMIDNNYCAVTIRTDTRNDFYLDDFSSELLAGDLEFVSKEYSGDEPKFSATLILNVDKVDTLNADTAVIGNGTDADSVLDEDANIAGISKENIDNTVKGYIKFPITEFDLSSDTLSLDLSVKSDKTADFSVYGVLDDDSRFAENFTSGITWNNAYANEIDGNSVDESKTVLIGTKSVTGTQSISLNVTDYVKTMADKGYGAVTFIIVKNNGGTEKIVTFEKMDSFDSYSASSQMAGNFVGIAADPVNPNNSVLYIEKSGSDSNRYNQRISIEGVIKSDNNFTEADLGKTYTVSFDFYAVAPEGTASVGNYCRISHPGDNTINGAASAVTVYPRPNLVNEWYTLTFSFEITEKRLGNTVTAIGIGSGAGATGIYIDNIVVKEVAGNMTVDSTTLKLGNGTKTVSPALITAVSAEQKDKAMGALSGNINIVKTADKGGNALRKTYAQFDKSEHLHINSAELSFNVAEPIAGKKVNLYLLNNDITIGELTWNGAYANDTMSNGMLNNLAIGGGAVATVELTEETEYTVDISKYISDFEGSKTLTAVFTSADNQEKIQLSNIELDLLFNMYDNSVENPEMLSPIVNENGVILAVDSKYRVDHAIEKVEFYVDSQAVGGEIINGEVTKTTVKTLDEGEYTAYAVVTYVDGTIVTSDAVDFVVEKQEPEVVYGDLDENGKVDTGDLAALKLFLAGASSEDEVNIANADADGNGKVDTGDLAALKLFLAGASDKLGPQ